MNALLLEPTGSTAGVPMFDDILRCPAQRQCDQLLGRPVEHFLAEHLQSGRSWPWIARELHTVTCGQMDVPPDTLRGWHEAAV